MSWVRIDDHYDEHPKFAKVGPLGMAVWMAGLAYCNRNLTDGHIPWSVARKLVSWDFLGAEIDGEIPVHKVSVTTDGACLNVTGDWAIGLLINAGLWEKEEGNGYYVHDYLEYQPSRAQVLAERERNAIRQGRHRTTKKMRNAGSNAVTPPVSHTVSNAGSNGVVTPAPYPTPDSVLTNVRTGADAPFIEVNADTPVAERAASDVQHDLAERLREASKNGKKTVGILIEGFTYCFGSRIPGHPSFLAKMAKDLGSSHELLLLMFRSVAAWPGIDDPHVYLQAAVLRTVSQRRASRAPPTQTVDERERHDLEILERNGGPTSEINRRRARLELVGQNGHGRTARG